MHVAYASLRSFKRVRWLRQACERWIRGTKPRVSGVQTGRCWTRFRQLAGEAIPGEVEFTPEAAG